MRQPGLLNGWDRICRPSQHWNAQSRDAGQGEEVSDLRRGQPIAVYGM